MGHSPDCIFIGYMKAGTEFLRSYFDFHPEISWSRHASEFAAADFLPEKYCGRFQGIEQKRRHIDMFEGLSNGFVFKEPNLSGEKWRRIGFQHCDLPMANQHVRHCPQTIAWRIQQALPNARILIAIRNQQDWLRSYYLHHIQDLLPRHRKFADFCRTFIGRCALSSGLYHETIRLYFELFGKHNVLVVPLEELAEDPGSIFNELCVFLQIDHHAFPEARSIKNKGKGRGLGAAIETYSRIGLPDVAMRRIAPLLRWAKPAIHKVLGGRDVFSNEQRDMLNGFYSASNAQTSDLIQCDLKKYGYV